MGEFLTIMYLLIGFFTLVIGYQISFKFDIEKAEREGEIEKASVPVFFIMVWALWPLMWTYWIWNSVKDYKKAKKNEKAT